MEISTFQQLKEYILNNDLSDHDINILIKETMGVWVAKGYEKKHLIKILEAFIVEFPKIKDRPLFVDVEQNKISIKDFVKTVF
jgi:hypothetical protein